MFFFFFELNQFSHKKGMTGPAYMQKLASCCVDGNVNWNSEVLMADIDWFKKHRTEIMESIPSLSGKAKRKKVFLP